MEIAKEENVFDVVEEDFRTLRYAITNSRDLLNLLVTPVIDYQVKEKILQQLFAGKIGSVTERFISLMTRKGRAENLPAIIEAFERLLDRERNVVPARITTAVSLDDAQRRKVEDRLNRISGQTVRAEYVVDPSIVGGFRARFEDKMIDASVRHQLERLYESLAEGTSV
jgi:F-type H+-transporting ATPase subunit delta